MLWLAPAGLRGGLKLEAYHQSRQPQIFLSLWPSLFWDFGSLFRTLRRHFLTRCRGSRLLRPRRCGDFGLVSRHKPAEHHFLMFPPRNCQCTRSSCRVEAKSTEKFSLSSASSVFPMGSLRMSDPDPEHRGDDISASFQPTVAAVANHFWTLRRPRSRLLRQQHTVDAASFLTSATECSSQVPLGMGRGVQLALWVKRVATCYKQHTPRTCKRSNVQVSCYIETTLQEQCVSVSHTLARVLEECSLRHPAQRRRLVRLSRRRA